jgi:hypothetical protein
MPRLNPIDLTYNTLEHSEGIVGSLATVTQPPRTSGHVVELDGGHSVPLSRADSTSHRPPPIFLLDPF